MSEEEYKKFKEFLESDFVYNYLRKTEQYNKDRCLAGIINFLLFTKEYSFDALKNYLSGPYELVPHHYLSQKNWNMSYGEVNHLLCLNFKTSGYLYHVTNTKYLDSILENGLLSLNKWFQKDVYMDCKNLNTCWDEIKKEKGLLEQEKLVTIPYCNSLYPERFTSVYVSVNLATALRTYTSGNELFNSILYNLIEQFQIKEVSFSNKYEFLHQLCVQMKRWKLKESQKRVVFDFCNFYYQSMDVSNNDNSSRAFVMVPNQRIMDSQRVNDSLSYQFLLQNEDSFDIGCVGCTDIECNTDISSEGLIGVVTKQDGAIKVYKKSK